MARTINVRVSGLAVSLTQSTGNQNAREQETDNEDSAADAARQQGPKIEELDPEIMDGCLDAPQERHDHATVKNARNFPETDVGTAKVGDAR